MISQSVVHRVLAARHLFHLASEQARNRRSVGAIAAINFLHDVLEIFLLAAAEHLHADVGDRTAFSELIDKLDKKLPTPLPFRSRLLAINRMRISSKHHGITPDQSELDRALVVAREYFDEASSRVFDKPFWSVSAADEILDKDVREYVANSERAFSEQDYRMVLIEARKAFYCAFEAAADANRSNQNRLARLNDLMIIGMMCPALSEEELQDTVTEPFDYIIFDQAKLDRELRADGIDRVVFENIRTITPAVYNAGCKWLIRKDDALFDDDLSGRAAYALENVPDLILRRQTRLSVTKPSPFGFGKVLKPRNSYTPFYAKASQADGEAGRLPEAADLYAYAEVPSFDGSKTFYCLFSDDRMSKIYVLIDDVENGDAYEEPYGDPDGRLTKRTA